jgi:adenylate kinase
MSNNIVFISGVHGVGKTSFCKDISIDLDIQYFTASEIIRSYKNKRFDTLYVSDIESNQDILIKAITEILDNTKIYLLDGHFCLLNKSKEIERISYDIFVQLGLKAIVVLVDDIAKVQKRLFMRMNQEYDFEKLKELQDAEVSYAKEVAGSLNIPFVIIEDADEDKIIKIEELINL